MDYPLYDAASPNTPLTDAELSALDVLLQSLPVDGAMPLDGMDGYLTALLVGPPLLTRLSTREWLPFVWGRDCAPDTSLPSWPFPSNQKRKRASVQILRHLRSIAAALDSDPDAWTPIFSLASMAGEEESEFADASDWCRGFLAAIDLDPVAWAPLLSDAELLPRLMPIGWLGGDPLAISTIAVEVERDLDDPKVCDDLSRAIAELVPLLWRRRGIAGAPLVSKPARYEGA